MYGRVEGFTVIEVTLFLGISALLFLVALVGTGAMVSEARFGDDVRRVESFLQGQYAEVASGVNPRTGSWVCASSNVSAGTSTPGASNCMLLGKAVSFTTAGATADSFYIVGTEPVVPPASSATINQVIAAYNPRYVSGVGNFTYKTAWGLTFDHGKRQSDSVNVTNVAFIRNPRASDIVTYVFAGNLSGLTLATVVQNSSNSNASAAFCFKGADNTSRIGAVEVLPGQGANIISSKFDSGAGAIC